VVPATVIECFARARETTVSVIAFRGVARNPISRRFAWGPSDTGSPRIGLYSAAAEPPAEPSARQQISPAAAGTHVSHLGIANSNGLFSG
jgi:hypothetical protein